MSQFGGVSAGPSHPTISTALKFVLNAKELDMKHHVERTSPKGPGMPFIGTCRLCGMTGLKASAALEDCENVRGLSVEQALVEIISQPGQEPDPAMPADGYYKGRCDLKSIYLIGSLRYASST